MGVVLRQRSHRFGHPCDQGNGFRTGTQPTFLTTAALEWNQFNRGFADQQTYPSGALTFVSRQREQIGAETAEVKATLRRKLSGIGMEKNSTLATCLGHSPDRLKASHFTLGCDERNQSCWRGKETIQMVEINHAVPIHRPEIQLPSAMLQLACGGCDRWMFHR